MVTLRAFAPLLLAPLFLLASCGKVIRPEIEEFVSPHGDWRCTSVGKNPITTDGEREKGSNNIMGYINTITELDETGPKYREVQDLVKQLMEELVEVKVTLHADGRATWAFPKSMVPVGEATQRWRDTTQSEKDAPRIVISLPELRATADAKQYAKLLVEDFNGKKKMVVERRASDMTFNVPGWLLCQPIAEHMANEPLKDAYNKDGSPRMVDENGKPILLIGAAMVKFGKGFVGFDAILTHP